MSTDYVDYVADQTYASEEIKAEVSELHRDYHLWAVGTSAFRQDRNKVPSVGQGFPWEVFQLAKLPQDVRDNIPAAREILARFAEYLDRLEVVANSHPEADEAERVFRAKHPKPTMADIEAKRARK